MGLIEVTDFSKQVTTLHRKIYNKNPGIWKEKISDMDNNFFIFKHMYDYDLGKLKKDEDRFHNMQDTDKEKFKKIYKALIGKEFEISNQIVLDFGGFPQEMIEYYEN